MKGLLMCQQKNVQFNLWLMVDISKDCNDWWKEYYSTICKAMYDPLIASLQFSSHCMHVYILLEARTRCIKKTHAA